MEKNSTQPLKSPGIIQKVKDLFLRTFSYSDYDSIHVTTGNSDLDSIIFNPKRNKEERQNDLIHFISHLFDAYQGAIYFFSKTKDHSSEPTFKRSAQCTIDGNIFNKHLCPSKGILQQTYLSNIKRKKRIIPPENTSVIFSEGHPFYVYTLPVVVFGKLAGMIELTLKHKLTELQLNKLKGIIRNSGEHLIS